MNPSEIRSLVCSHQLFIPREYIRVSVLRHCAVKTKKKLMKMMLADTEYAEPTTPLKIFQEGERASYSSATTKRLICVLEFADEKEKNLRTLPKTLFAIL